MKIEIPIKNKMTTNGTEIFEEIAKREVKTFEKNIVKAIEAFLVLDDSFCGISIRIPFVLAQFKKIFLRKSENKHYIYDRQTYENLCSQIEAAQTQAVEDLKKEWPELAFSIEDEYLIVTKVSVR